MRKITSSIITAIRTNTPFKGANTSVCHVPPCGITTVTFHGSRIAHKGSNGWVFNFCGYATPTTRDRINAVRQALGLPLVSFVRRVPTMSGVAVSVNEWF